MVAAEGDEARGRLRHRPLDPGRHLHRQDLGALPLAAHEHPAVRGHGDALALRLRGQVPRADRLQLGEGVDDGARVGPQHDVATVGEEGAVGDQPDDLADQSELVGGVVGHLGGCGVDLAREDALGHHEDAPRRRVDEQRLGVARAVGVDEVDRLLVDRAVAVADRHPGHLDRVAGRGVVADVADPEPARAGGGQGLDVAGAVGPVGGADRLAGGGVDGEDPADVAGVVGRPHPVAGGHQPARLDDLGIREREQHPAVVGLGPRRETDREGRQHARPRRHGQQPTPQVSHATGRAARPGGGALPTSSPGRRTPGGAGRR